MSSAPTTDRVATYARATLPATCVSVQQAHLRTHAAEMGLDLVAEFEDVGMSTRAVGRPGLDGLLASIQRGEIDCVLVWRFDRFANGIAHLARVLDEMTRLGVRFVSVQDRVDTSGSFADTFLSAIRAMAELESALAAERALIAMAAAKARGQHVGRPATAPAVVARVETLARTTPLSVRAIHATLTGGSDGVAPVSRSVVGRIVQRVRQVDLAHPAGPISPLVHLVTDLIQREYPSLEGPEDVAEKSGTSVDVLRKVFRRELGLAPRDYLERVRVAGAKRLLTESGLRAGEVAEAVGWGRADSASRAFHRATGMSMRDYRRTVKAA